MKHVVVIPAAGAGARFYELGKQYPKCLLPYQGKPIIAHLVEKVRKEIRPDEIRIVVKEEDRGHQLWQCLGDNVSFCSVQTHYTQGPATSLYSGLSGIGNGTKLIVILSDMVLRPEFPLSVCREYDNTLFLYSHVEDQSRWCITDGKRFYDKPKERVEGHALLGCYTFSNGLLVKGLLQEQVETEQRETQFSTMIARYASRYQFHLPVVHPSTVVDLGTLEEFLQNRTGVRPRHFNQISYTKSTVIKGSTTDKEKIRNEAMWLLHPPIAYRHAVPKVSMVDLSTAEYTMERIYGHNLRDLALYYDKSHQTWSTIFAQCWNLLKQERTETSDGDYWQEFLSRLRQRTGGGNSLFWDDIRKVTANHKGKTSYHGDLHFSNMFWCTPGQYLKVVDPRGEYYGHWLYDVAKLCHSVFGRYDYIDEGLYTIQGDEVKFYDSGHEEIEKAFVERVWCNLLPSEQDTVSIVTACLFLSMVPLHDDEEHKVLFRKEFERLYKKKPPGIPGGG